MKTKKQALEMFRTMSEEKLKQQRDMISSSVDYKIETKEFLIEAIDSCLNREQLTHLAMVPEADIKHGDL